MRDKRSSISISRLGGGGSGKGATAGGSATASGASALPERGPVVDSLRDPSSRNIDPAKINATKSTTVNLRVLTRR